MRTMMLLTMGAALASSAAWAEPPKTLHVTETVEIKAPVEKVWETVRDFDSLNKWHPGFSSDVLVSGDKNTVGAVRKLTIKDGPSFTEQLLAFDAPHHSMRYKILESPLPMTHYVSTISVLPGPGGTSKVIWRGSCKRKNTSDSPPEAESDAGVTKLLKGVYRGGLDNLKKMSEG
ncbi:MAG TPA: SRPBCC family protein [Candidatus Dormibacteraeota bacterium]|nr:SRPBCC family protein [Candidatus Dormibacteraeota bacterium]